MAAEIATLSTLSTGEYALMLASLESRFEPQKFHCGTCITQYGSSERLIKKTEIKRKGKGCFDFKSKSYRLDNIRYSNCIGAHAVPIDYILEAFTAYEKGMLPFEGTLAEQPNKMIEIFQMIEMRRAAKVNQGK